jgi:Lrp/AsnC family leucine-responsive transcriptional regulator
MIRVDDKDVQILELVQNDARLPQAEIGRRVGLSAAAVNERLKKLEQRGIITGFAAIIDPEKIGCGMTAFVEVFIEHPSHETGFIARMREIPEVQEVHHVTGEFSCLLKIKAWDRRTLQHLLLDEINSLPGVRQTRTVISLSTSKEDYRIPIAARRKETEPSRAAARSHSDAKAEPEKAKRTDRAAAKEHDS